MKNLLKIGCGCALLLLIGLGAFGYWWYRTGLEEPEGVEVEVALPDRLRVGEELELAVTVRNLRERDPFRLDDILIDNAFHDAFSVVEVTPEPELRHDMQLAVVVLYRFRLEVPPGAEQRVVFRLRAEKEGRVEGELMVGEGRRALNRQLAVEIVPLEAIAHEARSAPTPRATANPLFRHA